MTRSRTRQKILIYRPFPLAPFQAGLPLGRQLLLDVWKQEPVDWDALRKKYLDERPCHECGEMKRKDAFTKAQWKQETYRVCKECTAQKREAGTPYRCTQCGLWHAACHFASKHQNPRWSMYRVCLSCDAKKKCSLCQTKQTKEYFSAAAWKARHLDRRICLRCQAKTCGHWTCAVCKESKSKKQFSVFLQKEPSGQHGRQVCNTCHVATVQAAIRKRAAVLSAARVEPLRKRMRHTRVLKETWEAIAQERLTRTCPMEKETKPSNSQQSSALAFTQDQKTVAAAKTPVIQPGGPATEKRKEHQDARCTSLRTYMCPACGKATKSTLFTGKVQTQGHCGRQFRVANGIVCKRYMHTCPTCGTKVESTKSQGRIQVKHKNATGRDCKTHQWESAGAD